MSLISSPFYIGSNDKHTTISFHDKVTTLPRIEHPSKFINNDDKYSLDIRGKSSEYNRSSSTAQNYSNGEDIPDNINVIYGLDRDKVRLPIFGRRPSSTSSTTSSIERRKSSSANGTFDVNELESILKEKVRLQLNDIRTKFRHSIDFDNNGKISYQALKHIIASIFGVQRQISPNQIDKLLEKLHLKNLTKISFDEFVNSFSFNEERSQSALKIRESSSQPYFTKRTAPQMFLILKEKARTKNKELINFCPLLDGGPSSKIFKSQLCNIIVDMGYKMNDKEFDKLWNKFDVDGFYVITSEIFVKLLTNEENLKENRSTIRSEAQDQQSAILKSSFMQSSISDSQSDLSSTDNSQKLFDHKRIEKWFNTKLPKCIWEIESDFKKLDTTNTGNITSEQLLKELKEFGLFIEDYLVESFLKYLNIRFQSIDKTISYKDIIDRFKDKLQIINNRIKALNPLLEEEEIIDETALDKQVKYVIAQNYEKIKDKMNNFDKNQNGTINKHEMKILIEDILEFPLRPDEYRQLYKQFPIDSYGSVLYKDYLKQINDQPTPSQQQQQSSNQTIPQWDYMRSSNIRDSLKQNILQDKKQDKNENNQQNPRSIQQLNEIVKTIVRTRSKDIEDQFKIIDRKSYGELTQDYLFELFQRLSIKPEITHKEIELIWSQCLLKQNKTLDFHQFLRQFGYSKESAHYPNAKENPPKRGDSDCLLTSNKLYGDSILTHESTRQFIKSNWNKIRQEFIQIDPYKTGFIQQEEFDEILTDVCPAMNQQDLQILKNKFQTTNDARINYVQFLQFYAPNIELTNEPEKITRKSLMIKPMDNYSSQKSLNQSSTIDDVSIILRRKLSHLYKHIRRSFKRDDVTNCGSVSIPNFKQILNEFKCSLNDEQFYLLISQLDTNMNGTINYNYFMQQFIKNK
ncbi:unnamed protein product [Adineta steineri]|uniref:EF-hand domain-containing protein n=1 Tax=Adineta steineri TaxID=433720 RepID=A0A815F5W0_9BILA|nr:unnamed protein product [Adineta steineri]CAF3585570.1 unnamed protein product [Adineta steineri]